jgi:hypothetical protein
MDALKRFEDLLENAVEGPLAEATTGRLQPVEVAKKLARALEGGQTMAADKTLAPNDFTVLISVADFEVFASFRQSLERELAAYLRRLAAERGLSFIAPLRVVIIGNSAIRPRRMRVTASITEAAHGQPPQAEDTARLPVADVRRALQRAARLVLPDGRTITLDKQVTSLGRNLDNDIVIEDKRVSRRHAQIRYEHRNYCLYDLASANGAFVNGQAVSQVILRDGDLISLGGVDLAFHRKGVEKTRGA